MIICDDYKYKFGSFPSLKCEIWNLPTLYKLEIALIGIIFVTYEDWKQKHCNLVHFSFSFDYLR